MSSSTFRHLARLRISHGIEVTITRGEQTCTLVAVPGKSSAKVVGADGAFSTVALDDWLIAVSDFTIGASGEQHPKKGDLISLEDAKWYVTHPDQNTPVFSNFNQLDRPAVAWRVHSMSN